MVVFLTALHIIICLLLIAIVLLQAGKGAEIGAAFGGGASQTMFGSRGAATVFQKATAAIAVAFMLTSLGLAYYSRHSTGGSVVEEKGAPPATQSAPAGESTGTAGTAGAPGAAAAPGEPGKPGLPGTAPQSGAGEAPAAPAAPANP